MWSVVAKRRGAGVGAACMTTAAAAGLALAAPASAQPRRSADIDYVADAVYDDGRDRLDVWVPDGAREAPVLVFFHGGALRMGDKSMGEVVANRMVPEGFVVVAPNYRLSPAVQHPTHVNDAAAAVAWVARNIASYGGDPARIYLSGHSAGGYLAVLLALDPSHLRVHGIDMTTLAGTAAISPFLYVEETARDRPKIVWGDDPADWLEASVTPHIAPGKGPMLLLYADGDEPWRKEQNERFAREMTAAGNTEVRVIEVVDRDHRTIHSAMTATDDAVGDLIVELAASH